MGAIPRRVTFSTPEQDAQRRDFTINGLFFDPIAERLIDYVGGQRDLEARLLRAIGNPADRFREDRLRMLRAVRFATMLGFDIEPATWRAVLRKCAAHSRSQRRAHPRGVGENLPLAAARARLGSAR